MDAHELLLIHPNKHLPFHLFKVETFRIIYNYIHVHEFAGWHVFLPRWWRGYVHVCMYVQADKWSSNVRTPPYWLPWSIIASCHSFILLPYLLVMSSHWRLNEISLYVWFFLVSGSSVVRASVPINLLKVAGSNPVRTMNLLRARNTLKTWTIACRLKHNQCSFSFSPF